MNTSINQALRLITLWIAWLLAMLFHVDLGPMPLFHGQSPEINSHGREGVLPPAVRGDARLLSADAGDHQCPIGVSVPW